MIYPGSFNPLGGFESLKLQVDVLKKEVELLRSSLEDKEEVIAAKNLLIDHLQKMRG